MVVHGEGETSGHIGGKREGTGASAWQGGSGFGMSVLGMQLGVRHELGLAREERRSCLGQCETNSCWATARVYCLGQIWVEIGLKNGLNIGL